MVYPYWIDEAASAYQVIENYLLATPGSSARARLSGDLSALLALGLSDELADYLDGGFGCYYNLRADDRLAGDWIREIIEQLRGSNRAGA